MLVLHVQIGSHHHPLTVGAHTIGRDMDCEIVLSDPGISRRHARIVRAARTVSIEDLQSQNGVLVNDNFITTVTLLSAGDIIVIGESELRLVYKEALREPAPPTVPPRGDVTQQTRKIDVTGLLRETAALRAITTVRERT